MQNTLVVFLVEPKTNNVCACGRRHVPKVWPLALSVPRSVEDYSTSLWSVQAMEPLNFFIANSIYLLTPQQKRSRLRKGHSLLSYLTPLSITVWVSSQQHQVMGKLVACLLRLFTPWWSIMDSSSALDCIVWCCTEVLHVRNSYC